MNERIKELEKQCWSHYVNGVLIDGHLHFDVEKFAKLLIKECVDLCDQGSDTQMTSSGAANMIRLHFGIKS
jgi:hypothetical protein